MKLLSIIALLTSAAYAAPVVEDRGVDGPSGHEVEIRGIAYAGSGCPANSVDSVLSSDLTTLTLLYSSFVAQAGKGIMPKDYRKNCQLNVKLHYPQGWQFSIFKADYRGAANLPAGATGTCRATYYFSGDSHQSTTTQTITGPFVGDYLKTDVLGVESTVWSPCGTEGMLNINAAISLNPLDAQKSAYLTSDSTDLKFKQICHLQWRKCNK